MAVKNYGIHDKWTDLDKLNKVDIKSVDGVIESVKINGEEAGGGGGGSDFSTARVTVTMVAGKTLCTPYIVNGEHSAIISTISSAGEYIVVLYKGLCAGIVIDMDDTSSEPTVTVTGNATAEGTEVYITGDCTITIS